MPGLLEAREYVIRRKVFTFFSAKFHLYDMEGNVIGFSKQKAFKLKEDIRIYSDESMSQEVLIIKARNIIDFGAAYDVVDAASGSKIGALRRKGFSSMLRDSWEFMDAGDNVIGKIQEDSMGMALIRRFLVNLIPQSFHASAGEEQLATYQQHFNPFIFKMTVTVESDLGGSIDRRVLLAAGILLAAIEGRQK